jgi:acetyl esterase/lipase
VLEQAMTAGDSDPNFQRVDPGLRAALASVPTPVFSSVEQLLATRGIPRPEDEGPWRPDVTVEEVVVPGLAGAPPVRVLAMNTGRREQLRPAVLFMHGGGFIGGSVRRDVARMQGVAQAHDCVLVSVDYRLAPEAPFPGPRDDCYAALKWLHANAERLGVDATRIALLGESAGGGLAAQLALAGRDRGEVPILAQVLVYPMLDDRTGSTQAVPAHIGTYVWTRASNRFGWTCFLGMEPGGPEAPRGAAPAREADLAGLPPAWIGVGGLDLFVGDNVAYAQRLMAAGVSTGLLVTPGAYHGFNRIAPEAPVSKAFNASWNQALAGYLRHQG